MSRPDEHRRFLDSLAPEFHDERCESGTAAEPETWTEFGAACACHMRRAIAEGKRDAAEFRARVQKMAPGRSIPLPGSPGRDDWMGMNIKQTFDDAWAECEEYTALAYRSHCRSFRQGAQECREMLARFVEQGGDASSAAQVACPKCGSRASSCKRGPRVAPYLHRERIEAARAELHAIALTLGWGNGP